jgi:hypothetical protein
VQAFCAGVVGTANATEYELTPTNNAVNTACTTPLGATNESMPMPMACTMSNLWVNARAGGATAGSGVIKVYKNSVATAITCSLGTGSDKQCSDTTHTAAFAAGDTYKITVLTNQATDTTNGVRVALVCN